MKQFSILPLSSFVSKHVVVDTGILYGLLQRMGHQPGADLPMQDRFGDAEEWY